MRRWLWGLIAVLGCMSAPAISLADSMIEVSIPAREIAYSPVTGLIYASVPGSAGLNGNSVISINPLTGATGHPILVGSEPGHMAISDDGHYLYVELSGSGAIRQVDLHTGTAGTLIQTGGVREMAVLPGRPETLIVTKGAAAGMGAGVAIFDHGVALPRTGSPNHFALTCGGLRVHTYENEISSWDFNSYIVTPRGLEAHGINANIFTGNLTILGDGNGRVYSNVESVIDPETHLKLGSCVGSGYAASIVPDPSVGRIFYLANDRIMAYDYRTFVSLGFLGVPKGCNSLIRWGADGFAMCGNDRVYVLRSASVGPAVKPAELAVTVSHNPDSSGAQETLVITVQNRGPGAATGVAISETLSGSASFISATASQGQVGYPNNVLAADVGALAPQGKATVTFTFARTKLEPTPDICVVRGDQPDPYPFNNIFFGSTQGGSGQPGTAETPSDAITLLTPGAGPTSTAPLLDDSPQTGIAQNVTLHWLRPARPVTVGDGGKDTELQGALTISSHAAIPGAGLVIRFYLIDDGRIRPSDIEISHVAVQDLAAGSRRETPVKVLLPHSISASGKYLAAVLSDKSDKRPPGSASPNVATTGPLP